MILFTRKIPQNLVSKCGFGMVLVDFFMILMHIKEALKKEEVLALVSGMIFLLSSSLPKHQNYTVVNSKVFADIFSEAYKLLSIKNINEFDVL